jgi:cell division protein ZapA
MRQVSITLNGRSYRLGCGEGEEARLKELTDYLGAKIEGLRPRPGQAGDERLLVMAAILVTDELFEARARLTEGAEAAVRRSAKRARLPRPAARSAPEEPAAEVATAPPGEDHAA